MPHLPIIEGVASHFRLKDSLGQLKDTIHGQLNDLRVSCVLLLLIEGISMPWKL